jgi:hypothetical protein
LIETLMVPGIVPLVELNVSQPHPGPRLALKLPVMGGTVETAIVWAEGSDVPSWYTNGREEGETTSMDDPDATFKVT